MDDLNPTPARWKPADALDRLLNLLRRMRGPQRRSELLTAFRFPGEQLQSATFTRPDRYPVLFAAARRLLAARPHPRVLSFGCSTGEEVFSLASYLPDAEIVGVELNRWCLRQCQARARRRARSGVGHHAAHIHFLHALSPHYAAEPPFDAVFCLAVLQDVRHRTEGRSPTDTGFTFARFEQKLGELDRKLTPGGFLFLDHCDFRFTDTALSRHYRAIAFPGSQSTRERPLFNRENRRTADEYIADRCFQKRNA